MGFTELNPQVSYKKLAEFSPGDVVVIGHYEGTVSSVYGENFKFREESGNIVVVNKSGSLSFRMQAVKVGDFVKIIYNGVEKLNKGAFKGKNCHNISVLVDPERSGQVNNPAPIDEAILNPNTTDEATDLF